MPEQPPKEIRTWTDQEMQELDKELEPYREYVDKKVFNRVIKGNVLTIKGEKKWLEDKGAIRMRKNEMTVLSNFDEYSAKLDCYYSWKGRKEYGKKMELERLDKVADSMRV